MGYREWIKRDLPAVFAMLLLACWIMMPRSAKAALIQFDFTTTTQVGLDQLPGYGPEDSAILRGRVIFDTSRFESAEFGFLPRNYGGGGELVLTTLSARGDFAIAQADFWLDDQLMWSGSDVWAGLGYQRQGRDGGFDGGWGVRLEGFSFSSIEGAAPTGAVTLSEFGHSGDPIADFLLNFNQFGSYWMASMAGFNRSLGGGHGDDVNETFSVHVVPEPSLLGVFALALIWMAGSGRKRAVGCYRFR